MYRCYTEPLLHAWRLKVKVAIEKTLRLLCVTRRRLNQQSKP